METAVAPATTLPATTLPTSTTTISTTTTTTTVAPATTLPTSTTTISTTTISTATTTTTVAPATTPPTPTTTTLPGGPLAAFGVQRVLIGEEEWIVAVADQPDEQAQGLMGITDFGGLDGMLFLWEDDVFTFFWMKDTPIPLDIAFFEESGDLIGVISMVPCEADPCERYGPDRPFRYAVEAEPGRFDDAGHLTLLP